MPPPPPHPYTSDYKEATVHIDVQVQKQQLAFAGAGNYGVDTFIILKLFNPPQDTAPYIWVINQSKHKVSDTTHTLDFALENMSKDLERHGVDLPELVTRVEGVHLVESAIRLTGNTYILTVLVAYIIR
jgi:hypothetical protein